ncbi:hypothetical protein CEXT_799181, partial [Caerostris extrusa]
MSGYGGYNRGYGNQMGNMMDTEVAMEVMELEIVDGYGNNNYAGQLKGGSIKGYDSRLSNLA